MNIKTYNIIMVLATIIAWLGFFIITNSFNPIEGSFMVFVLFYVVLFLSMLGTLSLIGFWWRRLISNRRGIHRIMVVESFRQAVIFSAVLIVALWLQAGRVLTWWNIVLLIILAAVLEFLILVFNQSASNKSPS